MKKVLIIEDDNTLRDNMEELLTLYDYEVLKAKDGAQGLEMARKIVPDIIVCDIMMPEKDGFEVLESLSLNDKTRLIPFIFLSAKTDRQDVRKGMNMGADDYLTKPFAEDELISAIRSRLAKTEILKELKLKDQKLNPKNKEGELHTLNDLKNYFDDHGEYFKINKDDIIYNESDHSNYIYLIRKNTIF